MLRIVLLFSISLLILAAAPARAATTVYGASIFSQSGPVINAGAALGAADGVSATLNRPGELILQLGLPATAAGIIINGSRNAPGTQVRISVGAIIGGVAIFTATQNFPNSAGPASFDFSADCALISATGCNLVRYQITGSPVADFSLDGTSAISGAPEPGIWMLMIIGFVAMAWRLKQLRRSAKAPLAVAGALALPA